MQNGPLPWFGSDLPLLWLQAGVPLQHDFVGFKELLEEPVMEKYKFNLCINHVLRYVYIETF